MKTIICILVVLTLVIGGPVAYGADLFFKSADPLEPWSSSSMHWFGSCDENAPDLGGPPGAMDTATICTGNTCLLDIDAEVMTISTQSGATLIIPSSRTLTLNKHEGVSTIDGQIGLSGKIDIVIDDGPGSGQWHQFAGGGEIVGEDIDAKILIQTAQAATPNELIVSTTIRGMLEIGKLDPLKNDQMLVLKGGSIIADDHGTLRINTGAMRDEADAGERSLLEVSKFSDAVLQIDVGCAGTPPLSSFCAIFCLKYTDAKILEGTLDLDSAITTEGDLTMEPGGVFDVDASASASFRIDCGAP